MNGAAPGPVAGEAPSDPSATVRRCPASDPTGPGRQAPVSTTRVLADGHLLEVQQLAPSAAGLPTLVFLHEGLGCVALWRRFPAQLAAATGCGAVVFSRYGYGLSDPFTEPRTVRYMHEEADRSLPALFDELGIVEPVLVGHSDGASIALLHAGATGRPVAGLALLAPHVFVEEISVAGIEAARRAYLSGDLRQRLAKYHRDPDATFFGWNDIWLSPEFRSWNIEGVLGQIACPVLVVQGTADPYGTLAQAEAVLAGVRGRAEQVIIGGCRHSPHLDAPQQTVEAATGFIARITGIVTSRDEATGGQPGADAFDAGGAASNSSSTSRRIGSAR